MPEPPTIVESIQTLGFDAKDIKILINGHGHCPLREPVADFKKLTGVQALAIRGTGRRHD